MASTSTAPRFKEPTGGLQPSPGTYDQAREFDEKPRTAARSTPTWSRQARFPEPATRQRKLEQSKELLQKMVKQGIDVQAVVEEVPPPPWLKDTDETHLPKPAVKKPHKMPVGFGSTAEKIPRKKFDEAEFVGPGRVFGVYLPGCIAETTAPKVRSKVVEDRTVWGCAERPSMIQWMKQSGQTDHALEPFPGPGTYDPPADPRLVTAAVKSRAAFCSSSPRPGQVPPKPHVSTTMTPVLSSFSRPQTNHNKSAGFGTCERPSMLEFLQSSGHVARDIETPGPGDYSEAPNAWLARSFNYSLSRAGRRRPQVLPGKPRQSASAPALSTTQPHDGDTELRRLLRSAGPALPPMSPSMSVRSLPQTPMSPIRNSVSCGRLVPPKVHRPTTSDAAQVPQQRPRGQEPRMAPQSPIPMPPTVASPGTADQQPSYDTYGDDDFEQEDEEGAAAFDFTST